MGDIPFANGLHSESLHACVKLCATVTPIEKAGKHPILLPRPFLGCFCNVLGSLPGSVQCVHAWLRKYWMDLKRMVPVYPSVSFHNICKQILRTGDLLMHSL